MNTPDLTANAATAVKNAEFANKAAVTVAKKTLDTQKMLGEAAANLVEQVSQVSKQISQGKIDVTL